MAMPILFRLVMLLVSSQLAPHKANEKPDGGYANRDYVRLTAEIRGTLEVEKDRIRVIVNQGGGCMTVYHDYWILDFGKNEVLKASAAKLKDKAVVLTGEPDRPLAAPHKLDFYQLEGGSEPTSCRSPRGWSSTSRRSQRPRRSNR